MKVAAKVIQVKSPQPSEQIGRERVWQKHAFALIVFLLLTFGLLTPVVASMNRSLEQWGDALLQTWTLDWVAQALLHDPLQLFNANAFYPYNNSLAFSESLVGQAVLVAPLIWLTDNPVLAFNVLLLLSFGLSGWGVYLLVYELTGRWVAGVIAGLIFAFFPNRFEQLSHLHLLATQWMPLCLLFLRRFLQNWQWRNGALFGLFLILELLSSTYLGLFLAVVVGLYLVYRLAVVSYQLLVVSKQSSVISRQSLRLDAAQPETWNSARRFALWVKPETKNSSVSSVVKTPGLKLGTWNLELGTRKWLRLPLVLAICGLVVGPFFWPYLEVQRDLGFERSPAEVINWSAQPFYYLDIPKENKLNQWLYKPNFKQDWWTGGGGERALWLGILAWGLGLVGLVVAWRRRRREGDLLFYGVLVLVAVSFTFGPNWQSGRFGNLPLPYALLYNYVPGFQGLRVPVRFIYVVALGVAMLAGFGVAALQERLRWLSWPHAAILAGLLGGLLCLEYVSDVSINESGILRGEAPPAAKWLAAHPGPVLNVPLSGSDNSNLFYQYWTRGSWSPIMNGFSGFMPPAYDALKAAVAAEGFSPRLISLLQGLEVSYITIDSEDDSVRPGWNKLKTQLEGAAGSEAAHFGGTYIYALKPDNWLRHLSENGLSPQKALYFVEYRRNDPQLLELPAYFMQRNNFTRRENLYGNIRLGSRSLPALPANHPADFLFIEAGEDPALYGFRPEDKLVANPLLDVYRRSPQLLARSDNLNLSGSSAVRVRGPNLEFGASSSPQPGQPKTQYLNLTLANLKPQPVIFRNGTSELKLNLEPGLSNLQIEADENSVTSFEIGTARLLSAELWQGATSKLNKLSLRQDVVLLEAEGLREADNGLARIKLVPKGGTGQYTATLDVYNYPWGTHPQGHYGYWSVPLNGNNPAELEYRLDLKQKQVVTRLNGGDLPNYPPDARQFDITKYGRFGDFRASFNLYAGDKLAGSVRLFDFTIYVQGDKNQLNNRHVGAFSGYSTGLVLLVLPPEKK